MKLKLPATEALRLGLATNGEIQRAARTQAEKRSAALREGKAAHALPARGSLSLALGMEADELREFGRLLDR